MDSGPARSAVLGQRRPGEEQERRSLVERRIRDDALDQTLEDPTEARPRRQAEGIDQIGPIDRQPGPIQDEVGAKFTKDKPFDLVFHGGSGSELEEIRAAVGFGVVKMNVDTDTQYAFTREIAGAMFTNYDGVLKVDGEVGNKKAYDPRSYLKLAETGMAARVQQACEDLQSAGTSASA